MRFYEYESRRIVERAGIPVTEYGFCTTADEAREAGELIGGPTATKSQALTGGRRRPAAPKSLNSSEGAQAYAVGNLEAEDRRAHAGRRAGRPEAGFKVEQEQRCRGALERAREAADDAVQRRWAGTTSRGGRGAP